MTGWATISIPMTLLDRMTYPDDKYSSVTLLWGPWFDMRPRSMRLPAFSADVTILLRFWGLEYVLP